MYTIATSKLLLSLYDTAEIKAYATKAARHRSLGEYSALSKMDVSYFLARYLMVLPSRHLPRNANLFTLINSVVDTIMTEDGLDPNGPERYQLIHKLCQQALNTAHRSRVCDIATLIQSEILDTLFPATPIFQDKRFDTLVLVSRIYLNSPGIEVKVLFMVIEFGYKKFMKLQKRHGTKVPFEGSIPLFGSFLEAAIRADNLDLVVTLLKHDLCSMEKKVEQHTRSSRKHSRQYYHWSYVALTILMGNCDMIELLMERAKIHRTVKSKLIQLATSVGDERILDILITTWYPIKPPGELNSHQLRDYGEAVVEACVPAFEQACANGNTSVVERLLKYPHILADNSFLSLDAWKEESGDLRTLRGKLTVRNDAETPVTTAVRKGHIEIVRLLIQAGADPEGNRRRYYLWDTIPSVEAAAYQADLNMLRVLVEEGKVSSRDKGSWLCVLHKVNLARAEISPSSPSRDSKDVEFWKYLIDGKHVDLDTLLEASKGSSMSHLGPAEREGISDLLTNGVLSVLLKQEEIERP